MIESISFSNSKAKVEQTQKSEAEHLEVDFGEILKGELQKTIIVFRAEEGKKVSTSVSCSACTKVKTEALEDNLFQIEIKFTPNSTGIHRKSVRIYQTKDNKPSVIFIMNAKVRNK